MAAVSMLLLLILHCFTSSNRLIYSGQLTSVEEKPSFWSSSLLNLNYSVTDKEKKKKHKDTFTTQKYIKTSTENISLSWTNQLHKEQSSSFSRSQ